MFAWVSRTTSVFAAVAVKDVVPVTLSTPLCDSVPPVVSARLPLTVDAPSVKALLSVRLTWLPLVTITVLKLLPASVKVMSFAPAANVVTPAAVTAPLCVSAPLVVTFSVPDTVEAPRSNAFASTNATLFPLVMPTVLKLFSGSVSVMLFAAPAANVVVPVTVTAPLCVMVPPVATSSLPPTFEAPNASALTSVYWTLPVVFAVNVVTSFEPFVSVKGPLP